MTREEHLERAKNVLCDTGPRAIGSMQSLASDLNKHRKTQNHPLLNKDHALVVSGLISNVVEMNAFIVRFQ
jgi:hypothetical protein